MPLFLKRKEAEPGELVLWVHRAHLRYGNPSGGGDSFEWTGVPYLEISLGTPQPTGPPRIWYQVEKGISRTHIMDCSTLFEGGFHPSKGWAVADAISDLFEMKGVVCGRLNLEDPYEVFDYLKRVARQAKMHLFEFGESDL